MANDKFDESHPEYQKLVAAAYFLHEELLEARRKVRQWIEEHSHAGR